MFLILLAGLQSLPQEPFEAEAMVRYRGAAGAATSPIKQLLESIRDETALTRERAGTKPADNKAPSGGDATPTLLR